jgi:hypothetical protein
VQTISAGCSDGKTRTPKSAGFTVGDDFVPPSLMAYYRSGMINCGTAAEEYERAKRLTDRR